MSFPYPLRLVSIRSILQLDHWPQWWCKDEQGEQHDPTVWGSSFYFDLLCQRDRCLFPLQGKAPSPLPLCKWTSCKLASSIPANNVGLVMLQHELQYIYSISVNLSESQLSKLKTKGTHCRKTHVPWYFRNPLLTMQLGTSIPKYKSNLITCTKCVILQMKGRGPSGGSVTLQWSWDFSYNPTYTKTTLSRSMDAGVAGMRY